MIVHEIVGMFFLKFLLLLWLIGHCFCFHHFISILFLRENSQLYLFTIHPMIEIVDFLHPVSYEYLQPTLFISAELCKKR